MKAIIIGGGIGGLCAGLALQQLDQADETICGAVAAYWLDWAVA